MKKLLLPALFALSVVACGGQSGAPADEAVTTIPDSALTAPVADAPVAVAPAPQVSTTRPIPDAMPEGLAFSFPLHFRNDLMLDDNEGVPRRRVSVEFLEGDVASITASLVKSYADAGFRRSSPSDFEDGRRISFIKPGYGHSIVTILPRADRGMLNKDSLGLVMASFVEDPTNPY